MEQLLTAPEAATLLRLTRPALYQAVQRRQVPVVRIGGRLRFRPSDLEKLAVRNLQPADERTVHPSGW